MTVFSHFQRLGRGTESVPTSVAVITLDELTVQLGFPYSGRPSTIQAMTASARATESMEVSLVALTSNILKQNNLAERAHSENACQYTNRYLTIMDP